MLVNVVGRGGNGLLNVGPDRDGVIPPAHVAVLEEAGNWLETHGEEVIYGTRPGPFSPGDYGVSTHRDKTIYIHVLNWPSLRHAEVPDSEPPSSEARASRVGENIQASATQARDKLTLPAIPAKVILATALTGDKVTVSQSDDAIELSVPPANQRPGHGHCPGTGPPSKRHSAAQMTFGGERWGMSIARLRWCETRGSYILPPLASCA